THTSTYCLLINNASELQGEEPFGETMKRAGRERRVEGETITKRIFDVTNRKSASLEQSSVHRVTRSGAKGRATLSILGAPTCDFVDGLFFFLNVIAK